MKQSKTAVIPARTLAYPQRQTALENIATVATGGVYSCAVTTTGSVYCWGWNGYGQLGDGTTLNRARPVAVSQLAGSVKAVSTGADHTCAILISGMMQCWGINWGGQLGNGTTENTALPITVSGLSDVTAISVGSDHTCALVRSSGLYCWGRNDYGQLGDGTTTSRLLPTGVSGLSSGVSAISAGRDHTCAILTSGTAHCWGRNSTGQLGDGTTVNQSAPVAVSNLGNGISQISAGGEHTCAHLTDGRMLCWGDNSSGQLGNGSTINQSTPGVVSGLPGSVNLISSGEYYTCALLNVGSLHCWGNNYYGQLGEGTTVGSEIPMTVAGLSRDISQISAGRNHTCAVLLTGNLRCWGQHKGGQVGDGLYSPLNTAVVGLGSGVKSVSVAEDRTCVLLIVGEIQCWGSDAKQQDFGDRRTQIPTAVSGVSDTVSAVSVSMTHTCLLLINGGVQCWGRNTSGQLGDGTSQDRVTPSPVSGLASGVKAISTGATHSCALLESGSVRCWGGNSRGQLGDGTIQNQTTPVSVSNLGNIVSQIGAGGEYTCVLLNTGGVQCWGHNALGQLGDGTTNSKTTPVAVSGLSNGVHQLSVGIDHACALLNSGSVVCWGNNIYGQLGDGTDANKTTPVAVYNLRDVRQISAGQYHTCAITGDGGAHCWGFNFDSQLGEGTTDNSAIPVAVLELGSAANPVTLVSAGGYHTCALLASTGLRCWGDNVSGQLGNANAWRTTPVDVVEPATQSPTPTPSPTITQSPTPTVTATPTLSPTLTTTPPVSSDDEPNNTCAQAKSISTDGVAQEHSFSIAGDEDWVRFDAMPNLAYRIEVQIPDSSPADVILEFYRNCAGQPTTWNKAFTPGVRLDVTTTVNAPLYFKFSNLRAEVAGPQVTYRLSVRTLTRPQSGAIILVAGRLKLSDTLQSNILQVTDQVYDLFTQRGYAGENIYYLAPDLTRPGRDALASRANLRAAITQWAKERVSSERTLTLYLIDHGEKDRFFIDETKQERLTSDDLNGWLNELEQGIPGLKVNVIIDACYSGSFISGDQRIGKAGRVIITSTSDEDLAFASATGAYFSDHFLTALRQDNHLLNSFLQAESAVRQIELAQQPWLDGDGDGIANEAEDRAVAAQRGFGYGQGALGGDGDLPWPPYIASAAPISVTNQHAVIQAEVRDDQTVRRVWAVIYPPSYTPPQNSQELAPETLPTIVLQPKGNGQYAAEFTGFDQTGVYRIAIHAEDDENLEARPLLIEVSTGRSVFLPLVVR